MKMLFQRGILGQFRVKLDLFLMRGSERRPPVPHDVVLVLSLNFLPQSHLRTGSQLLSHWEVST
jgi:hypothetical protein